MPTPIHKSQDSVVYLLLDGQPLLRETLLRLDQDAQLYVARQLGRFLYGLHSTAISGLDWDVPSTLASVTRSALQWILLGIESGETFWFTAHLGGARDIYA